MTDKVEQQNTVEDRGVSQIVEHHQEDLAFLVPTQQKQTEPIQENNIPQIYQQHYSKLTNRNQKKPHRRENNNQSSHPTTDLNQYQKSHPKTDLSHQNQKSHPIINDYYKKKTDWEKTNQERKDKFYPNNSKNSNQQMRYDYRYKQSRDNQYQQRKYRDNKERQHRQHRQPRQSRQYRQHRQNKQTRQVKYKDNKAIKKEDSLSHKYQQMMEKYYILLVQNFSSDLSLRQIQRMAGSRKVLHIRQYCDPSDKYLDLKNDKLQKVMIVFKTGEDLDDFVIKNINVGYKGQPLKFQQVKRFF